MSSSFISSVKLPIRNGVGVVGYTVFDETGVVINVRSTSGVVRLFEGVGWAIYQARVTIDGGVTAGTIVWDDGSGNASAKPFFIGISNQQDVVLGDYESVLDATWGGSTADSYITLADAHDFIQGYVLDKSAWDAATGQTRDAALRMATSQLDSLVYLGGRQHYTQSLKFPRTFTFPKPIDRTDDQIKRDIQLATSIQAAYLIKKGGRDVHAEAMAAGIRQSSESVGPIRDQFTYAGGGAPAPLCTDAIRIISKYRGSRQIFRA